MSTNNWKLLEPVQIGTMKLRNRIVMPPMETVHNNADGSVSEDTLAYYEERAKGGVGMIIVQNSFIDLKGSRSAIGMLSIATHHMIAGLSKLSEVIKVNGAGAIVQLGHGGRQTNPMSVPDYQDVAPSPVASGAIGVVPRELTIEEIVEIEDKFAEAATRAQMAGFDGVEIHGAHGYLIGQFISPKTNLRTDEYGGTFEKRCKFILNIIDKVRGAVGDNFTVGFRMSGDEYVEGGLSQEEATKYAKVVADTGKLDYIHVSAATYESFPHLFPVMYYERGHLLHLSDSVKKAVTNVPVIAVGSLNPELAEKALQEGKADLAAIGRGLIADPDLPNKIKEGKLEDIRPCILGNEGCLTLILGAQPIRCEVNPEMGRERFWKKTPAQVKKKVMVVGGGIAGMETARTATMRGHAVALYEMTGQLGGHLIEASAPKFKKPVKELLDWAILQSNKGNFKVHLNTEVTPQQVQKEKPDVLVIATGSEYVMPEGEGCMDTISGKEVLLGNADLGEKVVVVGGGIVGCETALFIVEELGKQAVIIEMADEILIGMELFNKMVLMERLPAAGIEIHTGLELLEINDSGVVCKSKDGNKEIACDSVVGCTGVAPDRALIESLTGIVPETYVIGDAAGHYKIFHAFEDAHRAVVQM